MSGEHPIAACPNPECGAECVIKRVRNSKYGEQQAFCNCGYSGPEAVNGPEAIRLHNQLCNAHEAPAQLKDLDPETTGWVDQHVAILRKGGITSTAQAGKYLGVPNEKPFWLCANLYWQALEKIARLQGWKS